MLVCVTEARGRRWNNGEQRKAAPHLLELCVLGTTPVASRLRVKKCLFFLDIVQQSSRYLVALWGQNGLQKWQIS